MSRLACLHIERKKATMECKMRIFFSVSSPLLILRNLLSITRPCKKHVRFQKENFCVSHYSPGNINHRRIDGKSPEEFDHFHVGGTTLCADNAKRALLEKAENAVERDQKRCKYSNNYPPSSPKTKRTSRFSSIFV